MPSERDRKLTTILCADVAGYSRLMNADEEATLDHLKKTHAVFLHHVGEHGGRLVNMAGDGLVCEFPSVIRAVECAVEVQNIINSESRSVPPERRMVYRIGINLGDVLVEGSDLFGDGVNVAARLEALAPAGGICISGSVFEQVKNRLPRKFSFLGNKEVKNISDPVAVYSLSLTEMPAPDNAHMPFPEGPADAAPRLTEEDARIRAYVKRQAAFYRRAGTFDAIILLLFIINLVSSTDYWWFLWPAGAMGFILLMEAVRLFSRNRHADDWEERKIREIKARHRRDGR